MYRAAIFQVALPNLKCQYGIPLPELVDLPSPVRIYSSLRDTVSMGSKESRIASETSTLPPHR